MARDEYQEARQAAAQHRQRAGELYAQHRSEGKDEALKEAREETARADQLEDTAKNARAKDTFQKDGEAAKDSDRRTWFEPGTVADDKMQQFEEAREGGILDQVTKYAARSVFDKKERQFGGAKMIGKTASVPFKAAKAFASRGEKDAKGQQNAQDKYPQRKAQQKQPKQRRAKGKEMER